MRFISRSSVVASLAWIALSSSTGPGCVRADVQKVAISTGGTGGGSGAGGKNGDGGSPAGAGGTTGAGGVSDNASGGATGGGGAAGTAGIGGSTGAGGAGVFDAGAGITPTAAGQLVITEIMADTTVAKDEVGEWIELYNPSPVATFDLFGCELYDSGNFDTISRHLIVNPGWFVTLARSIDPTLGFIPTYDYATVKLSNTGDLIGLRCGATGTTIDIVDFTTWPVTKGRSFSLDPRHYDAAANDLQASWCYGSTAYDTALDDGSIDTDYGSPGVTNPPCP